MFENFTEEFLYHGTSYDNAINIVENGLSEETYWGDEDEARFYADSYPTPALIKISYSEIKDFIEPNHTLIDYYYENEEDDDNMETIESWENSTQSAKDSLDIIGSVILPPTYLNLTKSDIIRI